MPRFPRALACLATTLLFLAIPAIGRTQDAKLHLIAVFDTTDKDIGESVAEDRDALFEVLVRAFDQDGRRHRIEHVVLAGVDATKERVLSHIRGLTTRKSDSILFYFSGHGGVREKTTQFISLRDGRLDRCDIRLELMKKSAKQKVILTDCCASYVEGARRIDRESLNWDVVNQLFFKQEGLTDIGASVHGEFAFCSPNGGWFTQAILANMCDEPERLDANHDGLVTWAEFKDASAQTLYQYSKKEMVDWDIEQKSQRLVYYSLNDTKLRVFNSAYVNIRNQTRHEIQVHARFLTLFRGNWTWFYAPGLNLHFKIPPGNSRMLALKTDEGEVKVAASHVQIASKFVAAPGGLDPKLVTPYRVARAGGYLAASRATIPYNIKGRMSR